MNGQQTQPLPLVHWPSMSQGEMRTAGQYFRGVFNKILMSHCGIIFIILSAYFVLQYLPSQLSSQHYSQAITRLWWPLKLCLLMGTGGAIAKPGFSTIGLLGGLVLLSRGHRAVRYGVTPFEVIKTPLTVLTTLGAAILLVLVYAFVEKATFPALAYLFAAALVGSFIIQFLEAHFYRRTSASLMSINVLLVFVELLKSANFSFLVWMLVGGTVLVCGLVSLIILAIPKTVLIDIGEPPRQGVLVSFSRLDLRWTYVQSILTLLLVAAFDALWSLFLPQGVGIHPSVVFLALAVFVSLVIVSANRMNRALGLVTDLDPVLTTRRMLRSYWVLRNVDPGLPTKQYFEKLQNHAQRLPMVISIVACVVTGGIITLKAGANVNVLPVVVATPFVIAHFADLFYHLPLSVYRVYERASRQIDLPWSSPLTSLMQLTQGAEQSTSMWTPERSLRVAESLLDAIAIDETHRRALQQLLSESDVGSTTNLISVFRKTLELTGRIDREEERLILSRVELGSAVGIILKDLAELAISIVLIALFIALTQMIFRFSRENAVLLLLGAVAALIPVLVGLMIRKAPFRMAIRTVLDSFVKWVRRSH